MLTERAQQHFVCINDPAVVVDMPDQIVDFPAVTHVFTNQNNHGRIAECLLRPIAAGNTYALSPVEINNSIASLTLNDFDFDKCTVSINKSLAVIDGEQTTKKPKRKRVNALLRCPFR